MNNQLSTTKDFFQQSIVKQKFAELMGKRSSQFITSVMQVISNNDLLAKATPASVYGAAITAAILDLPIQNNLGFAYIVPYNDKKTGQCLAQFQIGYKGLKQLAYRTGRFKTLRVSSVKKGELKFFDRLTGEIEFEWIQDEDERENAETIGYVSYFELHDGFKSTLYMTVKQLINHGKRYSKSFKKGYGVWVDDFDSMCEKTVTKQNLSQNAPLSVEIINIRTFDQSVTTDGETFEYVDNNQAAIDITPEAANETSEKLLNLENQPL